jgi:hypothetical protein
MCFGNIVYDEANGVAWDLVQSLEGMKEVLGIKKNKIVDPDTMEEKTEIAVLPLQGTIKQMTIEISSENVEKTKKKIGKLPGVIEVQIFEQLHKISLGVGTEEIDSGIN